MVDFLNQVRAVVERPEVAEAINRARDACTEVRWHPAMRKRSKEVRAECTIRAAAASAVLAGARIDQEQMRSYFLGEDPWAQELTDHTSRGAARSVLIADQAASRWAQGQEPMLPGLLAKLHTAAATGLVPAQQLGLPTQAASTAIERIRLVLQAEDLPVLAIAAIAHGALIEPGAFEVSSGVVGRAFARAVVIGRGLDPMGISIWEHPLATSQLDSDLVTMIGAYSSGTDEGLAAWIRFWADAVSAGAEHGADVASAVLAGKLSR